MALQVEKAFSQDVKTVTLEELLKIIHKEDGKPKLINFWATWCKPCVDELPYFVQVATGPKAKDVEFIFVSVDFQSVHPKVVEKARQLGLKGTVLHLNAPTNDWIDEVDKNWSGAIPYTILILPDGKRIYHYDEFENYEALKTFLDTNHLN